MPRNLIILLLGLLAVMPIQAQEPIYPPRAPEVEYEFSSSTITVMGSRVAREGDSAHIFIELDSALWPIVVLPVEINGHEYQTALDKGRGEIQVSLDAGETFAIKIQEYETSLEIPIVNYPMWLSLLPPILAILLALILKEVYVSLFIGVATGASIIAIAGSGSWTGIGSGILAALDTYIISALADKDHMAIIVFSLLIGGMVAVISRNGGMQGIVNRLAGLAKTAKSAQLTTYLMGMLIFFDDYANTLVVGNTMRPVTDRLKVSREKLSYIVDSTAAPVAALAFVTTWIGAELGYIGDGIAGLHGFPQDQSPYLIFLNSLTYSFYPILTLLFILILILTGKDFGPMLKAERRARSTGKVNRIQKFVAAQDISDEFSPLEGVLPKARYAVIPVFVLVLGVMIGLVYTGFDPDIWNTKSGILSGLSGIIGNSNSYAALLWASLAALVTAVILSKLGGRMSLRTSIDSVITGFKAMLGALIILTLAWALSGVTADMHTAGFLTDLLGRDVSPVWIPALAFLLSALVAFSTGSSWSTMAILYPIIVPLAWEASRNAGLPLDDALPILYNAVACVLAGSVMGDHISPISDTTVLSSLATRCDHIDHVRTQMPYALVVGTVAVLFGTIPAALGFPAWLSMLVALGILGIVVWRIGMKVEEKKSIGNSEISTILN